MGDIMRLIISQAAISKSICGNLNKRLKKRGMRFSFRRDGVVAPKLAGPPVGLGREIFMVKGRVHGFVNGEWSVAPRGFVVPACLRDEINRVTGC